MEQLSTSNQTNQNINTNFDNNASEGQQAAPQVNNNLSVQNIQEQSTGQFDTGISGQRSDQRGFKVWGPLFYALVMPIAAVFVFLLVIFIARYL